ncbi:MULTISPECIES: YczE/YyaS/YitT family protein [Plantibacter]|uniref:membrane protein YczE n=1 Tax=Plantibacter TaxID=190323 RepID=UPI00254F83F2|nr:hypothetical protein [Plantibacter sp. lyk4-40-MEA-4]
MTRRVLQLLIGLFLYGIAIAMIVRGAVGVAPWDVLTQGLNLRTGLSFGLITIIVGGLVLLAWIPLKQRPGVGTVLNVLLVGPSADIGLEFIPADLDLWARILLFAGGLLLLGVASGLYIGGNFGPGPRDGLMTGIHRVTGWPIWVGRTGVELVVLGVGWLLGGNVGIGTVVFAVLIGPICGYTIPLFRIAPRTERSTTAVDEAVLEGDTPPTKPIVDSPAN